jgi:miniconductance mechanosensitive channel
LAAVQQLATVIETYPGYTYAIVVVIAILVSPILQRLVGRIALRLAIRTESVVDDLFVDALRPYRFVYALPVGLAFFSAQMAEPYAYEARLVSGLLLIFLAVESTIKFLNGVVAVIRHKSKDEGSSSAGYVDLMKVLAVVVGIAFAVSITVEIDIVTLVKSIGVITAFLMFVFKEMLHSILASLKIASWNLIREGDWIIVPNYAADGEVKSIGLFDIKVQNWDLTTALIPTHEVLEVATTNYRNVQVIERARRIHEKLLFDIESIRICDRQLLKKIEKLELISDIVAKNLGVLDKFNGADDDPQNAALVLTNLEMFRLYIDRYLRSRDDLHQKQRFILVRALAPTRHGFPLDIYAFTRQTGFVEFANVQTSVLAHLAAMVVQFDLQFFQIRYEK